MVTMEHWRKAVRTRDGSVNGAITAEGGRSSREASPGARAWRADSFFSTDKCRGGRATPIFGYGGTFNISDVS
ncbi:hypothetical protein EA473_10815 [Natrarchaeobius chitinivorans]|uniref:Uncharacterized protein n=1 Tax=Natrarchaeobius chitinivorans TaxID=1679083 RepID=A0A3N6N824_NATCH|nr:hypothetical protein EA473_10815 [Natrarchaeobius chitinivorans]